MIGSAPARRTYRVPTDFDDVGQAFRKLMSWLRFIEYSSDLDLLFQYKARALMNNDQNQSDDDQENSPYRAENIEIVDT